MRHLPLENICDIQIGKTPSRSIPEYWKGSLPWVTISDLNDSRTVFHTKEGITEVGASKSNSKLIPAGTLLLSFKLSLGKRAIAGRDLFTNEAIAALTLLDPDKTDRDYLYWALGAVDYDRHVDRAAKGKTLNKAKLRKIQIPLPPLEEQKRIAGILDAADALRTKRRQSLEALDTLLQSTFLDMFGDPVTNPMGWEIVKVGDEIDFLTSGSRGWAKYYVEDGDIFIRIQNLKNGRLDLNDIAFVNAPDSAESKRTRVEPGDVLLSITADLGRTAVVPEGIGKAHINQHLAILRFQGINPVFVSYQLASCGGQAQFASLNREGVKAGLNFNDIRSIQLTKPPYELQEKFVITVACIEKQKALYRSQLDELDTLFASLQQRAFNGEL
jgi:type I restriction enzyme S subunit